MLTKLEVKLVLDVKKLVLSNGCWVLTKGCDNGDGYDRINIDQILYLVHRLSAFLYLGLDIEDASIMVCHKPICFIRKCWNPDHLYLGNAKSNSKDIIIARGNKCLQGHEYTIENTGYNSRGHMFCKQCGRDSNRRYLRNKKTS